MSLVEQIKNTVSTIGEDIKSINGRMDLQDNTVSNLLSRVNGLVKYASVKPVAVSELKQGATFPYTATKANVYFRATAEEGPKEQLLFDSNRFGFVNATTGEFTTSDTENTTADFVIDGVNKVAETLDFLHNFGKFDVFLLKEDDICTASISGYFNTDFTIHFKKVEGKVMANISSSSDVTNLSKNLPKELKNYIFNMKVFISYETDPDRVIEGNTGLESFNE